MPCGLISGYPDIFTFALAFHILACLLLLGTGYIQYTMERLSGTRVSILERCGWDHISKSFTFYQIVHVKYIKAIDQCTPLFDARTPPTLCMHTP